MISLEMPFNALNPSGSVANRSPRRPLVTSLTTIDPGGAAVSRRTQATCGVLPHDREQDSGVSPGTRTPRPPQLPLWIPTRTCTDDAVALAQAIVELLDAGNDAEARVDRAQWVVLVCAWIAEVSERAVTHRLRAAATPLKRSIAPAQTPW